MVGLHHTLRNLPYEAGKASPIAQPSPACVKTRGLPRNNSSSETFLYFDNDSGGDKRMFQTRVSPESDLRRQPCNASARDEARATQPHSSTSETCFQNKETTHPLPKPECLPSALPASTPSHIHRQCSRVNPSGRPRSIPSSPSRIGGHNSEDLLSRPGSSITNAPPCPPSLQGPATAPADLKSEVDTYLYQVLPRPSSETDLDRVTQSLAAVTESQMYYPDLDSEGARLLLQDSPVGTYLVRNSSDPQYLFALSVKTERGATSVRIQYRQGFFQLDCEERMRRRLPRFETVMDLVDFHVTLCREGTGDQCRWLEYSGRKDMVVSLTHPIRHSPPSLCHSARVAVNRCLKDLHLPSRSTDLLPLPQSIKNYLRAYPYRI